MAMAHAADRLVRQSRADFLTPIDEPRRPQSPSRGLTVRLIRDEDEWDVIRPEWEALFAASPYASPPLDFAWLRSWWRIYGPVYGRGGLQIISAWRGKKLVGALPLYEGRHPDSPIGVRRLQFISTGEAEFEEICPDYLNVLCLSGEEDCIDDMWECVKRLEWDELGLLDLPAGSPLLRRHPDSVTLRMFSRGSCPVADLTGGFESYLGRLSTNSRQQARRLLREAEKAGAVFEIVAADRAAGAFDDLVRLHQLRWTADRKPGVFAAPRFTAFHRDIVREWLPDGRAVLARLSLAGEPAAVLYGFVIGSKFEFYQSGVRREGTGPLRSPGNLAHLLLMKALVQKGVVEYDFLRGASSYKERLATRENQLVGVNVWRPSLRAATHRSIRLAARISRHGLRLLPRRAGQ